MSEVAIHQSRRRCVCWMLAVVVCLNLAGCASASQPASLGGETPGLDQTSVASAEDRTPAAGGAFANARERMVADQIEGRGVVDPAVLAAMRTVPRHRFMPDEFLDQAYADHPLPIGYGQTIFPSRWPTSLPTAAA